MNNYDPKIMEDVAKYSADEARRAYQREWRRNNPDKVRVYNARYWEKKGREYLAAMAKGAGA